MTGVTKVTLPDGAVVNARELSVRARLQLWPNSVTGAVEAAPTTKKWKGLKPVLHLPA